YCAGGQSCCRNGHQREIRQSGRTVAWGISSIRLAERRKLYIIRAIPSAVENRSDRLQQLAAWQQQLPAVTAQLSPQAGRANPGQQQGPNAVGDVRLL